ncbi:MAG TPA: serine hydrolase [Cyclobacteriaceae bacterium]|nr:serine hydrolase [Cyclobacteriaceae bacterium]
MKKIYWLLIFGWTVTSCASRLTENQFLLENMMKKHPSKFRNILKDPDTLEVQIIYTQINRDSLNQPHFKSFYFHLDSTNYFYPASTVKLPISLLALEKMNRLNIEGLNKFTPMFNDSAYSGQLSVKKDTTSENGMPSMAHYIKKILLVSDNDASNRLYEFVGQKEVNANLKVKGYNMRILHRLERPLNPDQNRHTEAVRFINHDTVVYSQPMLVNEDSIKPPRSVFKGVGYIKDNTLIKQPFDFTYKNFYPLQEQQEILKAILFPKFTDPKRTFNISEEDRKFVMKYMSQRPSETSYPAYNRDKAYFDAFCKFLMYGDSKKPIPPNVRIFNKVGDAYGYLLDNAYIVDLDKGVEFMLSAVINTNVDGVYNDGIYQYHKLGYPFMKNLGQTVYKYELKRKRQRKPDLSEFRLKYDQ